MQNKAGIHALQQMLILLSERDTGILYALAPMFLFQQLVHVCRLLHQIGQLGRDYPQLTLTPA